MHYWKWISVPIGDAFQTVHGHRMTVSSNLFGIVCDSSHMALLPASQTRNRIASLAIHFSSWQFVLNACNRFTATLMTIGTIDYRFLIRSIQVVALMFWSEWARGKRKRLANAT